MSRMLEGTRIFVTQAGDFMGPALCDALTAQGAIVVASERALVAPDAASEVVAALVAPLPPLVRAVVPGMLPRGGGWAIR